MDDLISRQAAIDAIWNSENHDVKSTASYNKRLKQLAKIIRLITELPSAQPEIIRCNDCKWYDLTYPCGTIVPDAFHCKVNDRFYEASHFCGYGERRE